MTASDARPRIAPLEGLRVGATACVVLLHACVPYAAHSMPGLCWPVHESTSRLVDVLFWGIELFVMPLFLVMAGFFAVGLYQRRGAWGLVRHRFAGLMVPFAFATTVLLPLSLYAWLTGWLIEDRIVPRKLQSLAFEGKAEQELWGFAHLWFLPYLFLYVVCYAGLASVGQRWPRRPRSPLPGRPEWLVLGTLVIASGLTIGWVPEVVFGFQHAFLPFASKWLYCGTFFGGGVWLAYRDPQLQQLARFAPWLCMGGLLGGTVAVWRGLAWLEGVSDPVTRSVMAASTAIAAWGISFGLHGVVVRRQWRAGPVIGYLSAASLWVYLSHHCLIALTHIDLKVIWPDGPASIKTLLAFTIATGVSLLLFEGLVRGRALGRMLGVKPRRPRPPTAGVSAANPARRAAEPNVAAPRRAA